MAWTIIVVLSLFMSLPSQSHPTSQIHSSVKVKGTCTITTYRATSWPQLSGVFTRNIDNPSGYVNTLCSVGIAYTLGLDNGKNYDSSTQMRRLSNLQGSFIKYAIYKNSGYSAPWGSMSSGNGLSLVGAGTLKTSMLYARIPVQSSVPAGTYQDMVAVTINF